MMVGLLTFASCAHMHHAPAVKHADPSLVSGVTGAVMDSEILAQGGDLALVPFKAGDQAEANDETDRISMMILKGIKDSLDQQNTSLHVIDASQTHPKVALQGYI